MRFYIADCHFGHDKVRMLDGRKFDSVEQMDAHMIEQWNSVVRKKKDEVVILGDFSSYKGEKTNELLQSLNGKKYLVQGNHDAVFLKSKDFDETLFEWIKPYAQLHDNNRKIVLCHYPIPFYDGQYHGSSTYMLYGHIHNTRDYKLLLNYENDIRKTVYTDTKQTIPCQMINCFTVFSDYLPLTLDQWIAISKG